MSLLVTLNGSNYIIPETNEVGWGSNLDDYFVAIAAGTLQKTGGSFTLSAETDFGASYGLKSLYLKSRSSNVASTGIVRLANNSDAVSWRNFLNNGDLALTVDASNRLSFGGTPVLPHTLTDAHIFVGNASNIATDVAVTGDISITNAGVTAIGANKIVNAQINSAAAIAYSKLTLTGSIVNADIGASAAIAYSKLNLATSIVNADVSASAAIAYSKLNLATSIVNADISASAAIVYSKLSLTGGILNADINASAAIAYSKLNLSGGIVNADVNASAAIAYSKLNLSTSIVNADVSASAAIAYSKLNLATSIVNADINASAAIAYSKLNLALSILNADVSASAAIVRSKLAATETADLTFASNKGIFYTDNTSNTVKITAPTSVTTYTMKWPIAQGGANQYLTNDGSGNLSWTNAAGTGTVNSGTQYQLAYYATSTNAVSGVTLITASRALASDANGLPVASATTATELGYVSGVTSAIQTQMNLKATDSLVVHLAGTENITGQKTVTSSASSSANLIAAAAGGNSSVLTISDTSNAQETYLGFSNGAATNDFYLFANRRIDGTFKQTGQATAGFVVEAKSADGNIKFYTSPTNNAGGTLALTIDKNQDVTFAGHVLALAGTVGNPGISFSGDPDTGLWNASANRLDIVIGGSDVYTLTASTFDSGARFQAPNGAVGTPSFTFSNDTDCGLYYIGTNDFALASAGVKALEINSTQQVDIGNTKLTFGGNQSYPILQVVQATTASGSTSTSTSFADTNLTASITPKFSSSKILVYASGVGGNNVSNQAYFTLVRGSTNLMDATNGGAQIAAGAVAMNAQVTLLYYDAPATTSATTYKVQYKAASSGSAIGFGVNSTQVIVLIEVAQ